MRSLFKTLLSLPEEPYGNPTSGSLLLPCLAMAQIEERDNRSDRYPPCIGNRVINCASMIPWRRLPKCIFPSPGARG